MDDQKILEDLMEEPIHPFHQDVYDNPGAYVTIQRDHWNRLVEIAGRNYQIEQTREQWNEQVKQAAMGNKTYPCRYDCGQSFTNSSNRSRHEKNVHGKGEQS